MPKDKNFSYRLSDETRDMLRALKEAEKRSMSNIIDIAIEDRYNKVVLKK